MVAAWRQGERPRAEEFLALHPELDDEAAIRLIYEETCLRQEAGLEVDPAEVVSRFPKWKAELEILLDCQRLMQRAQGPAVFPKVGEVLGGFRLLAELGRGALGRIFLGSQSSLADRPVVLKVTSCGREEHLSLARLQHMNIVPLYSEQVLPTRNLRILCMPYLGGATLARMFELLKDRPPTGRTGRHLLEALDQAQAALPISLPNQGPFRGTIARASYVQAICWIGACLADGLQYAHDRGLVHMDIKPSNVLVTCDGQPMLLDFHLARGPIDPDGPMPPWLGGTKAYSSPEQRAAMSALSEGRAPDLSVDGHSDIYSLGILLYEALGGSGPAPKGDSRAPLHRLNPLVSVGLSDLISKCISTEARERYPDAAALATDLRRHLNHLPLLGVPNRSQIERWRKWRRRQPSSFPRRMILLGILATTAIAATAVLSDAYRQRIRDIEAALGNGQSNLERHQYSEAANALKHGLALAEHTPAVSKLKRAIEEELSLVVREKKAGELHQLADLIRFRYGLAPQPSREVRSLDRRGREIWEARSLLLRPIRGRREPELDRSIRTDLRDFVTVWADLHVRLAPESEADEARREALRWLEEGSALLGPSPALTRLGREYAEALGISSSFAIKMEPQSAWEHCDLGRSYLRSGIFTLAAEHFEKALDLRPQDFWPNFYQGLCAYHLERYEDAINDFRVCIALAPESAECYFNRALAHEALGQTDQALGDYGRALQLDRSLTDAALNRGLLHYAGGRYDEAACDLEQALGTASGREIKGVIHYNRALIDLARGNRLEALSSLKNAEELGHAGARSLRGRLRP